MLVGLFECWCIGAFNVVPEVSESVLNSFFFLINLFYFIYFYFWLCWVFVAARGLSLVAASGGYCSLQCAGFSLWWLLLLGARALGVPAFSSYGTQAQ